MSKHFYKPYCFHGMSDWRANKGTTLTYTWCDRKVQKQPEKQTVYHLLQERREPSRREEELRSQLLSRRWK
jgi:hypothetical protein